MIRRVMVVDDDVAVREALAQAETFFHWLT